MRRWRIKPEDLVVVYDDLDLNQKYECVQKVGGTHNGMRPIVEEIGTEQFSRIRVDWTEARRDRDYRECWGVIRRRRILSWKGCRWGG